MKKLLFYALIFLSTFLSAQIRTQPGNIPTSAQNGGIPPANLRDAPGLGYIIRSKANGQFEYVKDSIVITALYTTASNPNNPKKGDLWLSSANGNLSFWDGSAWNTISGQADWNDSNPNSMRYIRNKPSVDLDSLNELQDITLSLAGTNLIVEIEKGNKDTVSLASFLNTWPLPGTPVGLLDGDDFATLTDMGTTQILELADGKSIWFDALNPAPYAFLEYTGTPGVYNMKFVETNQIQTLDSLYFQGNNLRIKLKGVPVQVVSLSQFMDNTDAQALSGSFNSSTNSLNIALTNGGSLNIGLAALAVDSTNVADSGTIDFNISGKIISGSVKDGSITPAKLDRAYASPDTIYILATGQSNAGYRGLDSPSPQSNVQTWNGSAWATAVVDTNSHIGFEFAKLMGQRYPKKTIRYIHVYRDGNFIQTWYNGGVNYNDIVTYSNAAGVPHYDYMLWMQGEANASTASKQVYESMFDTVLTDLSANSWFGNETDIIVKSLSYDYTYSGPERFFEELNFRNDINIRFVNTIDLGDGIHVNGDEINEVARRMFNSVDKTELNPKVWEHNPLTHVVVTSDSTDYVGVKKLGVNSFQNTYDFNLEGRAYINRGTQNLFISGGNDTYSNATGRNVGIGFQTLTNINNSAFSNTAIGANAGFSLTSGTNNTLIGKGSGFSLLGGTDNVMIGSDVGLSTTSGSNNLFIGSNAGYFNTTGTGNVGMGALALRANISQPYNSAYGFYSSFGATGQLNSSFGAFARQNGGSGNLTTAIGAYSGFNYTGSGGVFLGYQSGYSETGDNKLVIENSSSTTGLIVGDFANDRAGVNKTTAGLGATLHVGGDIRIDSVSGTPTHFATFDSNKRLVIGSIYGDYSARIKGSGISPRVAYFASSDSLKHDANFTRNANDLTIGSSRLLMQYGTWNTNINGGNTSLTGTYNVAIGSNLSGSSLTDGTNNVMIGNAAGYSNTGGDNNFYMGNQAGYSNITSDDNLFIGYQAGYSTTGASNVMLGAGAGRSSTSVSNNAYVGTFAGYSSTGSNNVSIGFYSSFGATNTGSFNAIIGRQASQSGGGSSNVKIGYASGFSATGDGNVFLGASSGYNETGSNKLYIENSSSSTPLLLGDFAADSLRINGTFSVRDLIGTPAKIGMYTGGNQSTQAAPGPGLGIESGTLRIKGTNIPSYASTAAAAADGALTSGQVFKVSNGDGTSAIHVKD